MRTPRLARQRGVAVVTALLLTTLAVTIVASLFWQQQVQVRSMENQRLHLQTRWILRGALDWARLILRQDGLDSQSKGTVTLNGVWATPLAETRLDQYVERERLQNESYDASLSGQIQDAQSRYNLINLAAKDGQGQKQNDELQMFTQLLVNLQLNPSLAPLIADYVVQSQAYAGPHQNLNDSNNGEQPMPLLRVDDLLAIRGVTANAVEKLRDFVIVLPVQTPLNVNTAPAELLAALVPNTSVSEARAWVEYRKRVPFETGTNFDTYLETLNKPAPKAKHDGKSSYFLVQSRILLDRATLNAQTLIAREGQANGWRASVVWTREY